MKVLLTGASGFVGSHILQTLVARDIAAVVLLRPSANRRFIEKDLLRVEVREGSITEPSTLSAALEGITHLIHCAGCTKALRTADYFLANQVGTRNVVAAVNRAGSRVERLVHISSLAASHPATALKPALEEDPCEPVSAYGRSKWLAEEEVRQGCRVPFRILRPCAVYGPRDRDFLMVFRAVRRRWLPLLNGGRQEVSLVFVEDLARVAVEALTRPHGSEGVWNVAHPDVVTGRGLAGEIGRQLGVKPVVVPMPKPLLWIACLLAGAGSALQGKPGILSSQKYRELAAPGWVCDIRRLQTDYPGLVETSLTRGIGLTLEWYRREGWLGRKDGTG